MTHLFAFGIKGTCSFVQKQNAWVSYQRTGDGNALLLPSGQLATFPPTVCVVVILKTLWLIIYDQSQKCKKCMFDLKIHAKKGKNAKTKQKVNVQLENSCKQNNKNAFSLSKFIQKKAKMKKRNIFFCFYIHCAFFFAF